MQNDLNYQYNWDNEENFVEDLVISDTNNSQSVVIKRVGPDEYSYSSKLIGDENMVDADKTFPLYEALYYAHVNLGILPVHSKPIY